MSEYIFILVWVGIMAWIIELTDSYRYENILSKRVYRVKPAMALLVVIPLIWMTTMRPNFADTGAYLKAFNEMPDSYSSIGAYISSVKKDRGFYLLSALLKPLLMGNERAYLFVIASIQALIIASIFRKFTSDYCMAIFLFVASTDYISWMYNGIRQFMAVVIIFGATMLAIKKKFLPLLLVILLASTMHQSALIMIPFIFIAQGEALNKKTIVAFLLILVAVAFDEQFTGILDEMMQETQYANMVTDWKFWNDDGTSPLRVLIYSLPAIFSVIGLRFIRKANSPVVNYCANMSIFSAGLYLLSMVTSGIFIGRLPIFFSMYGYLLLIWVANHMFTVKSKRMIYACMIVSYIGFYYYQMHYGWGLI